MTYCEMLGLASRDLFVAVSMHKMPNQDNRTPENARVALEGYRRRLLDLGGRNRFLNFTHRETARTQVRLIDITPQRLFDLLASEKLLSVGGVRKPADLEPFLLEEDEDDDGFPVMQRSRVRSFDPSALANAAAAQGINPGFDLPSNVHKTLLSRLQTLLFEEPLKTRLQAIYDEAKRSNQELGINTLNCAIGFLEWYESENSDRVRLAPLLILPIEMKRTLVSAKYQFHVSGIGEDPHNNPSLLERLVADFGIRLPSYEDEEPVESFFHRIEAAVVGQRRWKLRRMATISLLNFAKLALYNDLDASLRPTHALIENQQVVMDLICGNETPSASEIDVDVNVDHPSIAQRVPLLVTEADASQFAAIAESMSGKSLVIEGPPGTGKSQTITNIIAASLAKGERVLFLAEKLAALDVVKSKLDYYGLGTFCLELHSTKARKSDVHQSFKDRLLKVRGREQPLATIVADLNQQKLLIQEYLDNLHAIYGKLGLPLHDLIWREQRMRLAFPTSAAVLEDIVIPLATEYNEAAISSKTQGLDAYETMFKDAVTSYGDISNHPWNGLRGAKLPLADRQALIGRLRLYKPSLEVLFAKIGGLSGSGNFDSSMSLRQVLNFANLAKDIAVPGPTLLSEAIVALGYPDALAIAGRFINNVDARATHRRQFDQNVLDGLADDSSGLKSDLEALAQLGEDETPIYELSSRITAIDLDLTELNSDRSHLSKVFDKLGQLDSSDLGIALALADLVLNTDRQVLLHRTSGLLEEANHFEATAACEAGRALAADRRQLEATVDFTIPAVAADVKAAARVLTDAGSFWMFKADARKARALAQLLCPNLRKMKNAVLADALLKQFDHLVACQKFGESRSASVLHPLFAGLETNFGFIEKILVFASTTRNLIRFASGASILRRIAFSSTIDELDGFAQLMRDGRTRRLIEMKTSDWEYEFANKSRCLDVRKKLLLSLASRVERIELSPGLRLFELRELVATAVQHRDLTLRINGDGAAKRILEAAFNSQCDDCSELKFAIAYFKIVTESGIPIKLIAKLRAMPAIARDTLMMETGDYWRTNSEKAMKAVDDLISESNIDPAVFFGSAHIQDLQITAIVARLSHALDGADSLEDWLTFEESRRFALEIAGEPLISLFESAAFSSTTRLSQAFAYCVIRTIVRLAIDERPRLRVLAGTTLEDARRRFRELDRRMLELSRLELAGKLDRAVIDPGNGTGKKSTYTGKALILSELQKKTKYIAIRELVLRSGVAMQQLKPCFMMSPLSVAQYLPPGAIEFDVVVIDEASQMRPEDSLAALSRAKRAIIVGDQKQLPPTSFFERAVDEDDVPDEDAVDNESVLDLALSQYGHSRGLKWHYRSRHESLIAFSNRHFYNNQLIVMPSPNNGDGRLGVKSTYVQSTYAKGRNPGEAEAVVEAVLRFMRTSIEYSIGIVAVNKEQRDLIQELLDRAIADDEAAQTYVQKWEGTLYPYFVKNLESVQGDERDVMFISTVYGPSAIGGNVAQRFGPILGASGWRRLNVLFTRARSRVELFTSMLPSDIRVDGGTASRGVVAFRDYLEFARSGRLEAGRESNRAPDSDFEISVGQMLEARGYEVIPQVGVENYFIDLAVRNPKHGGFVLGIECDGATYHSSRSARDRDRTREEALVGLGWSLYRIWSTDWFADPAREFEKLNARLLKILE